MILRVLVGLARSGFFGAICVTVALLTADLAAADLRAAGFFLVAVFLVTVFLDVAFLAEVFLLVRAFSEVAVFLDLGVFF